MLINISNVTNALFAIDAAACSAAHQSQTDLRGSVANLSSDIIANFFPTAVMRTVSETSQCGLRLAFTFGYSEIPVTARGDTRVVEAFESLQHIVEQAVALHILAFCLAELQPATADARHAEARALAAHIAALAREAAPFYASRRRLSFY